MPRRRVAFISTGGTIASLSADALDVLDYTDVGRKMDAPELLARFQEVEQVADILPVTFSALSSTAITPADMLRLRDLIHHWAAQDPELDGFVVGHGTATLEETAYFLNLTLETAIPVVLVGAQRPASALGTDAAGNLLCAIRTAASPAARGLGVLVALNDEIHAAREVTKSSTYRLQTFRAPDFGVLGHADGDGIHIYRAPLRKHCPGTAFRPSTDTEWPRVDIVPSYAGADDLFVEASLGAGARGIVSAGMAPGIPAKGQRSAFERAVAAGIIVVQSSRAGSGRVARRQYLRDHGMVAGDNLSPQKARILLLLALTLTRDPEQIQEFFWTY